MVLYNDLRLYTALKQEYQHFTGTEPPGNRVYRKTAAEWDIYAHLAERLGHIDDAKQALQLSLTQRLSTSGHIKLMKFNAAEGNIKETLFHAAKLVTLADRAFVDHTFPSPIASALIQLISHQGLVKVQNMLIPMNVNPSTFKSITRYFEYAEVFSTPGSDW
jgi:Chs5-Arf1p-binding protein BUD7/BCH1